MQNFIPQEGGGRTVIVVEYQLLVLETGSNSKFSLSLSQPLPNFLHNSGKV
jgi:hypothetical protein